LGLDRFEANALPSKRIWWERAPDYFDNLVLSKGTVRGFYAHGEIFADFTVFENPL
jgi:hypothetical protein